MQAQDNETKAPQGAIPAGKQPLSREELCLIVRAAEMQPPWRAKADREMEYLDGNQYDADVLRSQAAKGIPPAVENVIAPTIEGITGLEAKTRRDWRVSPDGDVGGQDVADALNFKLNQAERQSHADRACSDAFLPQAAVGLGWVEVARESDPTQYPYSCRSIGRNEIWWDMQAEFDPLLSNAQWLLRKRWMLPQRLALVFPAQRQQLLSLGRGDADMAMLLSLEGGQSTGLSDGTGAGRGWTVDEQAWNNPEDGRIAVFEAWYRRWESVVMLRAPSGRVVEYDPGNPVHDVSLAGGMVEAQHAVVTRMRRAFWAGPLQLHDDQSPYPHQHFPYVPFWHKREDATGVPYGEIRTMMFPQDALNAGKARLLWGMSAVRTERTKGAVAMTDAQFRGQVARVDADIVLDPEHMAMQGSRFEVKRDFQLSEQHYRMVEDARNSVERIGVGTAAFVGKQGNATSGVQEQTQVEQSNQRIAKLMSNFADSRAQVGELLLSLIIEDVGKEPQTVVIEGDAVREDRTVTLNGPEADAAGFTYLSNDVQRTRMKVALEDVPSSSSFRAQQLTTMGEAIKSFPPDLQKACAPFMVGLMDLPYKREVVEAIRAASQQSSPEDVEKRIKQAVADALAKSGNELKARELDMKERLTEAQIQDIVASAVLKGVQAAFSSMQGGVQVAQMPMIAPIADAIMQGAGYRLPNPGGDDPNFPTADAQAAMNIKSPYIQGQGAEGAAEAQAAPPVQENTSPGFPPVPQSPEQGMTGIETPTAGDNLPGA